MAMFISFKSFNLPYGISDAHTGKDPHYNWLHSACIWCWAEQPHLPSSEILEWPFTSKLTHNLNLKFVWFHHTLNFLAYFHLGEACHPASTDSFSKYIITQSNSVPYRSQCLDSNTGVHPHQPWGQQSEAPGLCRSVSESEVITVSQPEMMADVWTNTTESKSTAATSEGQGALYKH